MEPIYLDHAATSPVHPEVIQAMLPYYEEQFGNPSSIHQFGRRARQGVDEARGTIARLLQADPSEFIFTSGGTEADNLAIFGYAYQHRGKGNHIITSQVEHHAVLHACQELEHQGFEVTYVPVDQTGRVSVEDVRQALRDDTILVTLMYGNNEVGTIQPIAEIGALLQDHQAVLHTDAVQAFGAISIELDHLPVDMLSVSAHKINGPKGVGLLYVRDGVVLKPALYGGEQERKKRAGTENVAAIIGFAKAVEIAIANREERQKAYFDYCQTFFDQFQQEGVQFVMNGHQTWRLPHIFNVSFPGVHVEALLVNLDLAGIAASSGSACTAGSIESSHVLVAMHGSDSELVTSGVRFSFGLGNTKEHVQWAAKETAKIVKRLQDQEAFIR